MAKEILIDAKQIMDMIPHRYPMLLVDRMLEMKEGESAIGLKNVTINESFFQGHFPSNPVMPGVLVVEAMAQTAAILVVNSLEGSLSDKLVYFLSIDKAKFRKPIVPGDSVHIHVKKEQSRGVVWRFACEAKVDGKTYSEAIVTAMIADNDQN